jgi:hypothetical protein
MADSLATTPSRPRGAECSVAVDIVGGIPVRFV